MCPNCYSFLCKLMAPSGSFKNISISDMHRNTTHEAEGFTDNESQLVSVQDREGE